MSTLTLTVAASHSPSFVLPLKRHNLLVWLISSAAMYHSSMAMGQVSGLVLAIKTLLPCLNWSVLLVVLHRYAYFYLCRYWFFCPFQKPIYRYLTNIFQILRTENQEQMITYSWLHWCGQPTLLLMLLTFSWSLHKKWTKELQSCCKNNVSVGFQTL